MRTLEGLVEEYLEEMNEIRIKIQNSNEEALRSQRRMKERDEVWALRSTVLRESFEIAVVDQFSRFRQNGRQFMSYAKVDNVKFEPNNYFQNADDHDDDSPSKEIGASNETKDESLQSIDDLLCFTQSLSGEVGKAVEINNPSTKSKSRSRSSLTISKLSCGLQKKKKKKMSVKPILPSSRELPDSHEPQWITRKHFKHQNKESHRRKIYLCLSCPGVEFLHPYQLEQHLREHENSITSTTEVGRPCPHCILTFHHPQYFEHHVCCHEGIVQSTCHLCPGKKIINFSFETHLQNDHQMEKVLQCPNCLYRCSTLDAHLHHLQQYHADGKGVHGCYLCPAQYFIPRELHQHLHHEHNALQPLACDHEGCGKEFFTADALKSHQNLHSDRFCCPDCPRKFDSAAHLKVHAEVEHQGRRCTCRHCGQQFRSEQGLHEEAHEETEKVTKWQCHLCEKAFRVKHSLKNHLKWHAGEVWPCADCEATFGTKTGLEKHRRKKHSEPGEVEEQVPQRFPCEICGAALTSKDKLKRHLRIHTDDRKWACEVCGKTFREKYHLTDHQRTHSSDRPYACQECDKAYNQPAALWQHRKVAHGHAKK